MGRKIPGRKTMIISFLRHDCSIGNMVQLSSGQKPTKCGFYWYWKYGDNAYGGLHFFTAFGFRVVVRLVIKKHWRIAGK